MSVASSQLEIRGIVKPRRRWPVVLGTILGVGILGLGTGSFAYAQHYRDLVLPHTSVGNTAAGGLTPQELSQKLTKNCQDLQVKLGGAVSGSFRLSDLGLRCDVKNTMKTVMSPNENPWKLLASALTERQVTPHYNFDEAKASRVARRLTSNHPGAVRDPGIVFDAASASFVVDSGAPGKGLDPKVLRQAAAAAWQQQADVTTEVSLSQVNPIAPEADLSQQAAAATALLKPRVYLIGRRVGHLIQPDQKAQWLDLSGDNPTVSAAKVQTWLQQFTDETVDVKSEPGKRELTRDGKLLRLTKMAWDSQRVKNNAELAPEIAAAMNAGKDFRGVFVLDRMEGKYLEEKLDVDLPKPPYTPKAEETWASVDLKNHTVAAWEGGKLVFGPVAVVHGSLPSPTRPGIFRVQSKHVTSHMKRDAWDGSYDVWSPWTMYYSGDYALHGTTSRLNWVQSDYGGSHGCINMKPSDAKELYQLLRVGSPVVIHRGGEL